MESSSLTDKYTLTPYILSGKLPLQILTEKWVTFAKYIKELRHLCSDWICNIFSKQLYLEAELVWDSIKQEDISKLGSRRYFVSQISCGYFCNQ